MRTLTLVRKMQVLHRQDGIERDLCFDFNFFQLVAFQARERATEHTVCPKW